MLDDLDLDLDNDVDTECDITSEMEAFESMAEYFGQNFDPE